VHGGAPKYHEEQSWSELVLFYEYLHGDNGAGIGASHQTGWTGLVGVLPLLFARMRPEVVRAGRGVLGEGNPAHAARR
jgi:hypothetical protein